MWALAHTRCSPPGPANAVVQLADIWVAVSVCVAGAAPVPPGRCCPDPSAPCCSVFVWCAYLKYNQDSHRPSAVTGVSGLAGQTASEPGATEPQVTSRGLVLAFGY